MRGLRHLAALQSLLSNTSLPTVARSCAVAESSTQNSLQTTVTVVAPAFGFAAAAAARWYASDSGNFDPSMEARQKSSSSASTSLSTGDQSAESEDWLEDWAKLLEKNDVAAQAEFLHDTFGDSTQFDGPPLHELLNYNKKEEERARRRMFELQKQEQIRQAR